MSSNTHIGQRLSYSSHTCTVRYIGPVAGTQGTWLGVEWDDPTRGKHDGEHNGVRYFKCLDHAGSFIRPNRPADPAVDFLTALRSKYVEAEPAIDETNPVYFNGKLAQEVGFDKIRLQMAALQELRVVILDRAGIASGSSSDSSRKETIESTCPNIRQLDLSHNLFERWADIVEICRPLTHLTSLDASWNRFSVDTVKAEGNSITELSLNSIHIPWDNIVKLVHPFSKLKTLSLASNHLTTISAELPSLISLDLSNNSFTTLQQLAPLADLPLERLYLRDCPIESLGAIFPSVKTLDIYETKLQPSAMADLPTHFPVLKSLRFSVNDTDSLLTIARIGTLTTLNYSTITPVARKDAELFYLTRVAKTIEVQHPRYRELCKIHGEPTVRVEQTTKQTLDTRFIDFSCRKDDTDFHLRLPMSWNLYRVYASVAEKLDILPLYLKLIWETDEWDPVSKESGDNWDLSDEADDKWTKREVFLPPGPREVGHWIESNKARLRIERNEVSLAGS